MPRVRVAQGRVGVRVSPLRQAVGDLPGEGAGRPELVRLARDRQDRPGGPLDRDRRRVERRRAILRGEGERTQEDRRVGPPLPGAREAGVAREGTNGSG